MKARVLLFCVSIVSILVATGCATMIRGTEEPLSITSDPDGATAKVSDGQSCKTPCQVTLKRNQSVLVKFEKEGCDTETLSVFPTLAGAGVILGGLIDYGTGAVYSLQPNPAHVILKCKTAQTAPKQQFLFKEIFPGEAKDR